MLPACAFFKPAIGGPDTAGSFAVMPLRTRLSDLFASVRVPLVSAPMAGASGGLLAARVCQAGAFGFIGAGHADRAFLAQELDIARKELSLPQGRLPIGVGFITWRLEEQDSPEEVLKSLAPQVSCIWFAFGKHIQRWVSAVKSQQGCRTAVLVSSVDAAVAASSWPTPPDIIVVQGSEAGGHGSHDSLPIVSFVPAVLDALRGGAQRPLVLAAGGISRGTQLASMLALGADGVVAGTRFLATPEALYSPAQKERILRGKGEDTLRTILFDRMR